MIRSGAKKFYETVRVARDGGGFVVLLDGRSVKTPRGAELAVPSEPLAGALAAEWDAQDEKIDPRSMPLTALSCTMIDRIGAERDAIVANLLKYAETELLCYRVQTPAELAARQHEAWQPLIDWLADAYEARLVVTDGVLPVPQPQAALDALTDTVAALADWDLTVVSAVAAASGSLVIALALTDGRLDADEAFRIAQLDEDYQNERWGTVDEAARRRRALNAEIRSAATFVELARA